MTNHKLNLSSPVSASEMNGLLVNREYKQLLKDAGLDNFDAIWAYQGGRLIKEMMARSVICIEIQHQNRVRYFYLKRHNREYLGINWLIDLFFRQRGMSQGLKEFQNICRFRENRLGTAPPAAAGERLSGLFWAESFLITEDVSPFVSLENLLKAESDFFKQMADRSRRQILLREIARFARKMHQSGLNHCDFNTNHILVHYDDGADIPDIAMFDFQRIYKRNFLKFRWIIKSLAEFCYSLPAPLFDERDKVYLFLSYKNKHKMNFWDRLQWLWIRKKTERIRRHTEKMLVRRAQRRKKGLMER
jgi:heptose I phosphotransferase